MSESPATARKQSDDLRKWYYSIEIEKGVFTNGQGHRNIAITRDLLRSVEFHGRECLDIGTQETLVPILLKRGGAGRVVAYDRRDLSARVAQLQAVYGTDFGYVGGIHLGDLPTVLDARGGRYFDLVVFSGVLTQMPDPLGRLALVRGFSKLGGLFLIETESILSDAYYLVFNAKGKLNPSSHFFTPTTAWLDYVLRLLGLRPINVRYLGNANKSPSLRVAVLCRSEAAACPIDLGDKWASLPSHERNFRNDSQLDWDELRKHVSTIEHHTPSAPPRDGINAFIKRTRPYTVHEDDLRLLFTSSM